jgi:hypothetical protein
MSAARRKPLPLEKLREAWQRELVEHRDIPASVLKVALAIGWHFNRAKGGQAWPGIRRLSRLTSLASSTVVWAINWLEQHEYVHVQRRRHGKRNLPNVYSALLKAQQRSQHSALREKSETAIEQGVPITIEQGVPIATSTEPSTEPLTEPHIPIRTSAPTKVGEVRNEGREIRERNGNTVVGSFEHLKNLRAECYRLAGDYDANRGRALVTKALEEGADEQDVLDEIRVAIETGDDLGYALSEFWKHSVR